MIGGTVVRGLPDKPGSILGTDGYKSVVGECRLRFDLQTAPRVPVKDHVKIDDRLAVRERRLRPGQVQSAAPVVARTTERRTDGSVTPGTYSFAFPVSKNKIHFGRKGFIGSGHDDPECLRHARTVSGGQLRDLGKRTRIGILNGNERLPADKHYSAAAAQISRILMQLVGDLRGTDTGSARGIDLYPSGARPRFPGAVRRRIHLENPFLREIGVGVRARGNALHAACRALDPHGQAARRNRFHRQRQGRIRIVPRLPDGKLVVVDTLVVRQKVEQVRGFRARAPATLDSRRGPTLLPHRPRPVSRSHRTSIFQERSGQRGLLSTAIRRFRPS